MQSSLQLNSRLLQANNNVAKSIKPLAIIAVCYISLAWPFFTFLLNVSINQVSLIQLRQQSIALFIITFVSIAIMIVISMINAIVYLKLEPNIRSASSVVQKKLCRCLSFKRRSPTLTPVVAITDLDRQLLNH